MVSPSPPPSTRSSSPSSSSRSSPSPSSSMKQMMVMVFFCCVALYDAFLSYQYSKNMRQLLSLHYQQSDSSDKSTEESPPYGQRIGSATNRLYYYDESSNTNLLPQDLNDVGAVPVDDNSATRSIAQTMDLATITDNEGDVGKKDEEQTDGSEEGERSNEELEQVNVWKPENIGEMHGINIVSIPSDAIPKRTGKVHHTENIFETEISDEDSNEMSDEPWILDVSKRRVKKSTTKTFEEKPQKEESMQDGHTVDEEILFQDAIRENEHVSLYRDYQEYTQRSQRFPSVEERVKLYMSTWYNPPIFHCNHLYNKNNDLDDDPRIHYNYVTQWNNERSEYVTTIILRQSQSVPVNNHNNHKRERLFTVDNIPQHTRLTFAYNHTVLSKAPYKDDAFIEDVLQYFTPSLRRVQYPYAVGSASLLHDDSVPLPIPILLQVGDSEQFKMYAPDVGYAVTRPLIPVIKKFRYSMEEKELSAIIRSKSSTECNADGDQGQPRRVSRTIRLADNESLDDKPFRTQPIISIMSHTKRHYGPLSEIPPVDRPWNTKLNMAVYRGALTGMNKATVKHPDTQRSTEEEEIQWCKLVPRCNLVLQHGASTLVNAKITKVPFVTGVTEGDRVKPVLNGVTMEGESMNYSDMLQYKAIIMLEGNDVASGLKWALYSNSVVMMSKPTCTSWAMEELLQPYVHYIPLNDDLTNVEEQVQWMIDHDKEAEQIARNGRLWMTDLVFHPDAAKDTDSIIDETFRRYIQHFQYNPTLELSEPSSTSSEVLVM